MPRRQASAQANVPSIRRIGSCVHLYIAATRRIAIGTDHFSAIRFVSSSLAASSTHDDSHFWCSRVVTVVRRFNDVTQAPALLPPGTGAQVLCDRGYDADCWRDRLLAAGHQPVIPGRRHRLLQPTYDVFTYSARHLIENAFACLKSSRRIATRYEQTASAYAAFVALACVCLWLM